MKSTIPIGTQTGDISKIMCENRGISENRDAFIRSIFKTTAPHIDFLSTLFSFGLSHLWRRRLVSSSEIRKGDKVLDVCTGTGELAFPLSEKVGLKGSVTGIDFCAEMLRLAEKKRNGGSANISFILSDAKNIHFPDDNFDAVTVAFGMRNIPDTILALREIRRVMKPGGRFLCLELTRPEKRWFLPLYKFHAFKIMPFIANIFTKTVAPYHYLPKSIEAFYPPDEFRRIIEQCGFSGVTVHSMTLGVATLYRAFKNG